MFGLRRVGVMQRRLRCAQPVVIARMNASHPTPALASQPPRQRRQFSTAAAAATVSAESEIEAPAAPRTPAATGSAAIGGSEITNSSAEIDSASNPSAGVEAVEPVDAATADALSASIEADQNIARAEEQWNAIKHRADVALWNRTASSLARVTATATATATGTGTAASAEAAEALLVRVMSEMQTRGIVPDGNLFDALFDAAHVKRDVDSMLRYMDTLTRLKLVPSHDQFHTLLIAVRTRATELAAAAAAARAVPTTAASAPAVLAAAASNREHSEQLTAIVNAFFASQALSATAATPFSARTFHLVITAFCAVDATAPALLWYQRMIDARIHPTTTLLYTLIRSFTTPPLGSSNEPDPITACRLYDMWYSIRAAHSTGMGSGTGIAHPLATLKSRQLKAESSAVYNSILAMYSASRRLADLLTFYDEMRRTRTEVTTRTLELCVAPFLDRSARSSPANDPKTGAPITTAVAATGAASADAAKVSSIPDSESDSELKSARSAPATREVLDARVLERDAQQLYKLATAQDTNNRWAAFHSADANAANPKADAADAADAAVAAAPNPYFQSNERGLTRIELRGLDLFMLRVQTAIKQHRTRQLRGGDQSTEALEVGYTDVNGIDRVAWKLSLPAAATVSDVIEACIGSGRHIFEFRLLASKDGTVLCGNQPLRDHFPVSRSFGVAATALLNSSPLAGSGSGLAGSSSAALNRITPLWIVRKPTAPPDDL